MLNLLATLPLVVGANAGLQDDEPPRYTGEALVFRADLEHARAHGWIAADAEDAEVLERLREQLHARLRLGAGKFPEAVVRVEPERTVSVTFVGQLRQGYAPFLAIGLGRSGRFALRRVGTDAELVAHGTDIASERARLVAWAEAHADAHLGAFRHVPRAEGGPHPSLEWLAERPRPGAGAAPDEAPAPPTLVERCRAALPLLVPASPEETFDQRDLARVRPDLARGSLELWLAEERRPAFEAFTRTMVGRELAIVLEDEVVLHPTVAEPLRHHLSIPSRFTQDELRGLTMCLVGEPLLARLEFVEIAERELPDVKLRDDSGGYR